MQRSPDTEFHATVRTPSYFEDLTERCAVKLTSLLRITGPPHYGLWQEQVGGPHFRERTGEFIPIYAMDLEISKATAAVVVQLSVRNRPDGAPHA
jgi:hypothetical protein